MNKYQIRQLPLTIAVSTTLAAGTLQAATISVNNTGDGPVGTFPGECTLRSAITAANTNAVVDGCVAGEPGLDEIVFDPSLAGSTVVLSSQITIDESVSVTGPVPDDASGVTIDANFASRHFELIGTGLDPIDVSMNGLSLIKGEPSTGAGGAILARYTALDLGYTELSNNTAYDSGYLLLTSGGALAVIDGALTLSNSIVRDNLALDVGGGLSISDSDLTVVNSTITGNQASGLGGGGIAIQSDDADGVNVLIDGSAVDDNQCSTPGSRGGGLYAVLTDDTPATVLIRDSSFSGNSAAYRGGGLHLRGLRNENVTLLRTQVNDNELPSSSVSRAGGGLFTFNLGNVSLIDAVVQNNTVNGGEGGGGAWLRQTGDLEVRSTVISGNTVLTNDDVRGGGLYFSAFQAQIVDSEVSRNVLVSLNPKGSPLDGAGIFGTVFKGGPVSIVNSTISGNLISYLGVEQAGAAAGIFLNGDGSITNSTIAANRVAYGPVQASSLAAGPSASITNTLISGPPGADLCRSGDDIVDLGGNLVTDATCTGVATDQADLVLGPLDDNGGPTRTHALGAGSVAINAAGNCRTSLGIETDQRGVARGRLCDVGAFEVFEEVIFSDRFEDSNP